MEAALINKPNTPSCSPYPAKSRSVREYLVGAPQTEMEETAINQHTPLFSRTHRKRFNPVVGQTKFWANFFFSSRNVFLIITWFIFVCGRINILRSSKCKAMFLIFLETKELFRSCKTKPDKIFNQPAEKCHSGNVHMVKKFPVLAFLIGIYR